MRKPFQILWAVCGLVLCASAVFAAGTPEQKSGAKVQLVAYDYGHSGELNVALYQQLVSVFNARGDVHATIDYQFIPGDAYYPKLNAAIAAGNTPDIFSSHAGGVLKTYVDGHKVLDLDSALAADPAWKDRFVHGAFDALSFGGKIYAVPTSMAVTPIFYNKAIFAQFGLTPPQTYDQLKGIITTLVQNGIIPFADGDKDPWVGAMMSEIVANRIGGNGPYDAIVNGTGSWEDPSFIRMGRVLQELVGMKAFPDGFLGVGYDASVALFMGSKAAMFVDGTWELGRFAAADSPIKDKVAVMNFPTISGGQGATTDWLGNPDHNIAVSATARDQTDAVAFLKMWASEAAQKNIGEEQGKIIVTKTQLDPSKVPAVAVELNNLLQQMTKVFLFFDVGLGPKIGNEYNNTIQSIYAGTDPAAAFKKLQQYTQTIRSEG